MCVIQDLDADVESNQQLQQSDSSPPSVYIGYVKLINKQHVREVYVHTFRGGLAQHIDHVTVRCRRTTWLPLPVVGEDKLSRRAFTMPRS